ncbi:hypothetical protein [Limibacillus sp. MBR-115]|jgi:hypothetical protein|uniref:hypothetical protein n=1 Tax=Limibacillus sp. MBR-115 TaxID=3156465 RepID=UPI003397B07C
MGTKVTRRAAITGAAALAAATATARSPKAAQQAELSPVVAARLETYMAHHASVQKWMGPGCPRDDDPEFAIYNSAMRRWFDVYWNLLAETSQTLADIRLKDWLIDFHNEGHNHEEGVTLLRNDTRQLLDRVQGVYASLPAKHPRVEGTLSPKIKEAADLFWDAMRALWSVPDTPDPEYRQACAALDALTDTPSMNIADIAEKIGAAESLFGGELDEKEAAWLARDIKRLARA